MNSVAYLRVESLSSSEHNPFSQEDQTQFLGENAARLIDHEWNEYGPVVKVDVVPDPGAHSQAFTDMLAALEELEAANDNRCGLVSDKLYYDSLDIVGMKDALNALDIARSNARAAIEKARKGMGE